MLVPFYINTHTGAEEVSVFLAFCLTDIETLTILTWDK